jgi:hypothetical protein
MPERAHVTSVEALETFRVNLILYVSKARPTLEEVGAGVLRTRLWLQSEQRIHWEGQVRCRTKELEQAQQALSRVRLSTLSRTSLVEQKAVQKTKRALEEAEAKLKLLKQWNREFDSRVEPLAKQLEKLHSVLANDMMKATACLAQVIKTLAAYANVTPPSASTTPSPPAGEIVTDGIATLQEGTGAPVTEAGNSAVPAEPNS